MMEITVPLSTSGEDVVIRTVQQHQIDLGRQLLDRAKNGDTDSVRGLMSAGAPFTTDWLGTSALHLAAQGGHVGTCEVLLRAGCSRDARTKVDRTPLHMAAEEGQQEACALLLKHGALVDPKDMLLMTPLHWAVERGHADVVSLLIAWGASVDEVNKFDKTPYDIAMENGRGDLMQVIQESLLKPRRVNTEMGIATSSISVSFHDSITTTTTTIPQGHVTIMPLGAADVNVGGSSNQVKTLRAISTTTKQVKLAPTKISPALPTKYIIKAANKGTTTKTSTQVRSSGGDVDSGVLNALAALTGEHPTPLESAKWLEAHGITMLPTDDGSLVATALAGGQTVSLTDAGKLALDFTTPTSGNTSGDTSASVTLDSGATTTTAAENDNGDDGDTGSSQKLFAIVTQQGHVQNLHIPSSGTTQQFVVVHEAGDSGIKRELELASGGGDAKRIRTAAKVKTSAATPAASSISIQSKLEKELEEIRREAALYREQLLAKANEAEQLKRQLEQITGQPVMTTSTAVEHDGVIIDATVDDMVDVSQPLDDDDDDKQTSSVDCL